MIDDGTFGIWWTIAWVTAVLFTTSQRARTIIIDETLGLTTGTVGVAFMAFRTEALRSMGINTAQGVGTARFKNAWILTLAVNASFVRRTIGIGSATNLETLDLWIACKPFSADTDGTVLDNSAFGVRGANAWPLDARIDTTLFNTGLSSLAIRVDFAFGFDNRCSDRNWFRLAFNERITSVAIRT